MPRKFKYRLQRLLDIKKMQEKLAMNSMLKKEKEIQEKVKKITNLFEVVNSSRTASSSIGEGGSAESISGNQMRDQLIDANLQKITQIEGDLEQDLEHKSELNKVYEFALREVKKIDKHKENLQNVHKKEVNKKLENELEDLIQMRRKSRD